MLMSMTGHGIGQAQSDEALVQAEVRAVNNKHLKVSVSGDWSATIQNAIEQIVREHVSRGSVHVRLAVQWLGERTPWQLNRAALESYRRQLDEFVEMGERVPLAVLLTLPGVAGQQGTVDDETLAVPVTGAVQAALAQMDSMRQREGAAMLASLSGLLDRLEELRLAVGELAPAVVEQYASRLTERIQQLLQKHEIQSQPAEIIREVGMFAERADIHEELVRLGSHFEQFRLALKAGTSQGRKLDFLTQELLRETNTIGSKANDSRIANCVVEMKTIIDRIRELIQNVE